MKCGHCRITKETARILLLLQGKSATGGNSATNKGQQAAAELKKQGLALTLLQEAKVRPGE